MSGAQVIDGKGLSAKLRSNVADEVAAMSVKPGLAVILVGDDPASQVYVANKVKACREAGIESFENLLPENAREEEIAAVIENLNANPSVDGILLQLPLPGHLDEDRLIQMIAPDKDVDGLTIANAGRLFAGLPGLVPCTPQGSLALIKSVREDLTGLDAVVIGRSLLFGKPMAQLLLGENCTVTTAHSRTKNLADVCRRADVLVAATGRAQMVKGDWIKPGAIVIDVGITRIPHPSIEGKTKLVGDVDFEGATTVAGAITPVPGGVGPMTIAFLLANTVKAAKRRAR
ncbi:MAG: bifunctional methylenetetrahydrofolate dehydrogenase/methenyltetrahydrofolate cyclohydrolase FolD [Alphaproteobacteria bacterium]|nr:bifunctional methylenetetrahydrofolate dehydrogenase/methenyltetrahydrofolate cyclohydrolase FolD [Alphaproteobacteria bacterium]